MIGFSIKVNTELDIGIGVYCQRCNEWIIEGEGISLDNVNVTSQTGPDHTVTLTLNHKCTERRA